MKLPTARIEATIQKQGQISAFRSAYIKRNVSLFGQKRLLPASKTLAARFPVSGSSQPNSDIVVIGQPPDGFGKQILWHPKDKRLALVIFLNAGDLLGVMISGVRLGDTVEFTSAVGIASFAEETKNKGVGALIGLVATGATIGASVFGAPELAPAIGAAAKFAETQFEEQKVKTKRRDPFGEDPGSGHKARQEGGVIVSLPEARQIFYSGNDDHEERWIKKPGTRDAAHLPDHVRGAFFLRSGSSNKRAAGAEGDIIIAPWDHIFTDNFGFYRLNVLLTRGA